jgi:flagellar motor switch protein FliM
LPREPKDAVSTNDSDKNDTKDKTDGKKVYIFKKMRRRRLSKEGEEDQLRNTKNISKNFCKAFISFLKS